MMKTFRGQSILLDPEDVDHMSTACWYINSQGYAATNLRCGDRRTNVLMHDVLLQCPAGGVVDHKNRNKADNRKLNLRIAGVADNGHNSAGVGCRRTTSPFKGVFQKKPTHSIRARIKIGDTVIDLGRYATHEEAARAYDRAALEYHGEFAWLNFPESRWAKFAPTVQPPKGAHLRVNAGAG